MIKKNVTVKSGQKLKEVTHIGPTNTLGQILAVLIADQLLNNTVADHFEECWLCVPSGSNSLISLCTLL